MHSETVAQRSCPGTRPNLPNVGDGPGLSQPFAVIVLHECIGGREFPMLRTPRTCLRQRKRQSSPEEDTGPNRHLRANAASEA